MTLWTNAMIRLKCFILMTPPLRLHAQRHPIFGVLISQQRDRTKHNMYAIAKHKACDNTIQTVHKWRMEQSNWVLKSSYGNIIEFNWLLFLLRKTLKLLLAERHRYTSESGNEFLVLLCVL